MKNRLKEFRVKQNVSVATLAKAIEFRGVKYSEQEIIALETGDPNGFNLDAIFKASGFLRVPLHTILCIPMDEAEIKAKDCDECLMDLAVCSVLEGWFDISGKNPDTKQIAKWATKLYRDSDKVDLNFTEIREYGHVIVRQGFDLNALVTMEKYLQLKD